MGNIFGSNPPTIYLSDGNTVALQKTARNGRTEDFIREVKRWTDLNRVVRERTRGFRLNCSYRWEHLAADDMDSLIDIYNDTGIIKLKFSGLPPLYPVYVTSFRHGLADGLHFSDSAEIAFSGRQLLSAYPTSDLFYTMPPLLGRGLVVISLTEQ